MAQTNKASSQLVRPTCCWAQVIEWGRFEVDTWYYSPYPEPFASQQRLLMCEFCLKYFRKKKTLLRHCSKCQLKHPPGDEIYHSPPVNERAPNPAAVSPAISVFEVDGAKNKVRSKGPAAAGLAGG